MSIDPNDYVTVAHATRELGIRRPSVDYHISKHRLETVKIAGHCFVTRASLDAFKAARTKAQRARLQHA